MVTPKERVDDAPLGEPFRVLTQEAAKQVPRMFAFSSWSRFSPDACRAWAPLFHTCWYCVMTVDESILKIGVTFFYLSSLSDPPSPYPSTVPRDESISLTD